MKLNINVTKKDIRYGKQADPAGCAIARALSRNKDIVKMSVLPDSTVITMKHGKKFKTLAARNKTNVSEFIKNFDNDVKVEPIKFALNFCTVSTAKAYTSVI